MRRLVVSAPDSGCLRWRGVATIALPFLRGPVRMSTSISTARLTMRSVRRSDRVPPSRGWWVALCACAALLLGACGPRHTPPLMVGTNIWAGYEPLYLARDLGYYDKQPLRLVELGSTTQVMDALRAGRLDLAGVTLDEALSLVHEGVPIAVIWVMNISAGADAIVARSPITQVQQLRGRRVGVEQTAVGAYLLQGALQKAGVPVSHVNVVPLPIDEHVAAWRSGSVDALVTFDPARQTLLREGGREIFDSRALPGEIVDVLVARTSALQCCERGIAKLLEGQRRALSYLATHREDALLRMSRRPGSQPEEMGRALDGMELPDAERNFRLLQAPAPSPTEAGAQTTSLQATAQRLALVMHQKGIVPSPIPTQALIDARFVQELAP